MSYWNNQLKLERLALTYSKCLRYENKRLEQIEKRENNYYAREDWRRYRQNDLITNAQYYEMITALNELEAFSNFEYGWCENIWDDFNAKKVLENMHEFVNRLRLLQRNDTNCLWFDGPVDDEGAFDSNGVFHFASEEKQVEHIINELNERIREDMEKDEEVNAYMDEEANGFGDNERMQNEYMDENDFMRTRENIPIFYRYK